MFQSAAGLPIWVIHKARLVFIQRLSILLLLVSGVSPLPVHANKSFLYTDFSIGVDEHKTDTELAVKSKQDAQMLYRLSGMKEIIAHIPIGAAESFERTLTIERLPEQFRSIEPNAITSVIHDSFTHQTFDKYMVREMHRMVDDESKAKMIDWFHSSLGQRFVQAEIDHSLLIAEERFDVFKKQLRNGEVDERREMMMLALDKTMRASESAVEMIKNVQMAFNMSLSPFLPEQYHSSRADVEHIANENHTDLMMEYRQQTREVLMFTYQDFSIGELKRFNEMLATDAGQKFVAAINSGVKKAMFSASLDMGDGLGALVGQVQHGSGI